MQCIDSLQPLTSMQPRHRLRLRATARLAVICTLCLLFSMGSSGCREVKGFPSGAITITVKPGDTGNCAISPCRVLFEMPAGTADYQLLGNQVDFGRYPAGKRVNLGNFYEPITIEVVGAEVPKTYVYIPVDW